MQVVLLAAGLGSRLGSLTAVLPKALVSVAGEPLLMRAVRFARRLEPTEIVVVGGYGFPDVAAAVSRLGLEVTLIENPAFRDGNLVSLLSARPQVRGDFLLMNVDHIYRPAVAGRIAPTVDDVTAFIDVDRRLGPDDMKVARDDMKVARDETGRVSAIAKTLTQFDAGYVGMTRVPESALDRYWAAADDVLVEEGRAQHVERILARFASSERPPLCCDVSGIGWLEVDLAEERDHAEAAIREAPGAWV